MMRLILIYTMRVFKFDQSLNLLNFSIKIFYTHLSLFEEMLEKEEASEKETELKGLFLIQNISQR